MPSRELFFPAISFKAKTWPASSLSCMRQSSNLEHESRLITDNGGVFRAKQLLAICEALDIEKEYIHARQSWENLVETHFNVMRRMSQVHFEQVTRWQGAKTAHERFVTDYNLQPHWAHRKRDDNRLSPAEVLGQEKSRLRTPEQLRKKVSIQLDYAKVGKTG